MKFKRKKLVEVRSSENNFFTKFPFTGCCFPSCIHKWNCFAAKVFIVASFLLDAFLKALKIQTIGSNENSKFWNLFITNLCWCSKRFSFVETWVLVNTPLIYIQACGFIWCNNDHPEAVSLALTWPWWWWTAGLTQTRNFCGLYFVSC